MSYQSEENYKTSIFTSAHYISSYFSALKKWHQKEKVAEYKLILLLSEDLDLISITYQIKWNILH